MNLTRVSFLRPPLFLTSIPAEEWKWIGGDWLNEWQPAGSSSTLPSSNAGPYSRTVSLSSFVMRQRRPLKDLPPGKSWSFRKRTTEARGTSYQGAFNQGTVTGGSFPIRTRRVSKCLCLAWNLDSHDRCDIKWASENLISINSSSIKGSAYRASHDITRSE